MKFKKILLLFGGLALASQLPAEALDLMGVQWRGAALKKTTSEVKEGGFSYRWDAYKRSYVRVDRFSTEFTTEGWTAFSGLSFWVYSEEKTNANIALAVHGSSEKQEDSYCVYRFIIDWEGWKQINIPFEDFTTVRNGISWSDVSYIQIMNYYNATPVAGTVLYFNDFKLVE
jgi:hypothetical protein